MEDEIKALLELYEDKVLAAWNEHNPFNVEMPIGLLVSDAVEMAYSDGTITREERIKINLYLHRNPVSLWLESREEMA